MKPRTKAQFEISRLAECLPGLTKDHIEWAKLNCFSQEAIRRKSGELTCTLCGHQWKSKSWLVDSATGVECPHCGSELKVKDSKKRVIDEIGCMTIADVMGEYQVLRHFIVAKRFSIGENININCSEVVQLWFDEDGKCTPIARSRLTCSYRCRHPFSMGSKMNFRREILNDYKIWGEVYKTAWITDDLRKKGLTSFHGCNPYHIVKQLLQNDCKAETLIKT